MKASFLATLAVALFMTGAGALAQSSSATLPQWTKEQGVALKAYAESQKDVPFFDPNIKLEEGIELPQNATLHLIPDAMKIGTPETHAYAIVNDRAVLVDRASRKVIHVWE